MTHFPDVGVDYDENTKATSVRRVPTVLDHPSTFQPVVDAPNHVYNSSNTSHNPMRRKPSCFDGTDVDYTGNNEDTSVKRVPPPRSRIHTAGHHITMPTVYLPAVDVSKHVHNASHDSHNPTLRNSKRSDEICVGYHGNTKDTSPRRVPPLLSSVDVSKHVHNPSGDSHNPTH